MFNYQKPTEICIEMPTSIQEMMNLPIDSFVEAFQQDILKQVKDAELILSEATMDDFLEMIDFVEKYYTRLEGNSLSAYEYYRIIEYGKVVLLKKAGNIIGCIFLINYNTQEPASYALRLVLSPKDRGKGYATLLTDYACYLALMQKSTVVRATIAVTNTVSLFYHLNKVGMIIEAINPDLPNLTRYLQASFPMTARGLFNNKIDHEKLEVYMATHTEGVDFMKINIQAIDQIETMFRTTDFVIVAFLFSGNKTYHYFAISRKKIDLVTTKIFNAG